MYILSFLVPETHLDEVKQAVFNTGAGNIGHYHQCAWQTMGEGQFMPAPGSHPFVGEINRVEKIAEYKVEIFCTEKQITFAVQALKDSHPYETPAYHVLRCENF